MNFHAVRQVLDVAATVALFGAATATIWVIVTTRGPNTVVNGAGVDNLEHLEPVDLYASGATLDVDSRPKLVMVEFSDYQCPYCAKFANEVFPNLRANYVETGKLKYIFKNAPGEAIHPLAKKAAHAASCAGQQDRYWQAHDHLFSNQLRITQAFLVSLAESISLDQASYERCLNSDIAAMLLAEQREAGLLGVSGTPTFVLGRLLPDGRLKPLQRVRGAVSYDTFKGILDGLL
jgi:protein-disulfide isomerase